MDELLYPFVYSIINCLKNAFETYFVCYFGFYCIFFSSSKFRTRWNADFSLVFLFSILPRSCCSSSFSTTFYKIKLLQSSKIKMVYSDRNCFSARDTHLSKRQTINGWGWATMREKKKNKIISVLKASWQKHQKQNRRKLNNRKKKRKNGKRIALKQCII